jgi:hypothetical protein
MVLFDKVIGAFKVDNMSFEISRTTNKKIYSDLIRCTMLPKNTEFCFIDDTEYNKMKHDKIYYIQPKAYIHSLSVQEIVNRWQTTFSGRYLILPSYWYSWFSMHNRTGYLQEANRRSDPTTQSVGGSNRRSDPTTQSVGESNRRSDPTTQSVGESKKHNHPSIHKQVSEKLMFHIREFFLLTTHHSFWKTTRKKRTSFYSGRNTKRSRGGYGS